MCPVEVSRDLVWEPGGLIQLARDNLGSESLKPAQKPRARSSGQDTEVRLQQSRSPVWELVWGEELGGAAWDSCGGRSPSDTEGGAFGQQQEAHLSSQQLLQVHEDGVGIPVSCGPALWGKLRAEDGPEPREQAHIPAPLD